VVKRQQEVDRTTKRWRLHLEEGDFDEEGWWAADLNLD
jgi:hypothetical protein